jgi:VWFA-related protein
VCLAAGVLAAGIVSARQEPASQQRPPVFRGAANLVYVDVYPRREGRFVDGLGPQDFQVFEDGKPQKVEIFELIRFPPPTPGEILRDPTSQEEGDQLAADPRHRVFVIYLDIYHVEVRGSYLSGPSIVEFLRGVIGPADLFTVLTPLQYVSSFVFSRRVETLESEVRDNVYWGQQRPGMMAHTPGEEFLQTCLPRAPVTPSADAARYRQDFGDLLIRLYREDLLMTSIENLVHRLGALKDERKNVLFFSQGWVPQGPRPELIKDINNLFPRIGVGPDGRLGTGNRTSASDVPACDREVMRLSSIDFRRRFEALLTDASRANVSFYPVDVGGESRYGGGGPIETLRMMAAATDGRAVLQLYNNDLMPGLRQIADDLSAYYLLGYYSTNTAQDGRFRKIDVKIPQRDVSLTARRGYLAPSEEVRRAADAAAAKAAASSAVPAAVTEALADLLRLRAETALHGRGVRTPDGLSVTLELTSRELVSGRWSKGGQAELIVTGASASAPVTVTAPLAPGARSLVISVPIAAGLAGPWRVRGRLSAGAHLLEQALEVKPSSDAPLGDAMWFRAAAAASAPLRPAAEPLFRRTERLRIEWPVSATPSSHQARLLDRRGEPIAVGATTTELERDGQRIVAVEMGLAPLAEGDYLIELVAGLDSTSARRLVAFRVTR